MPQTSDNVRKCTQCGDWYKFATMTTEDQRFCPKCMREIDESINKGEELMGDHHAKHLPPYQQG